MIFSRQISWFPKSFLFLFREYNFQQRSISCKSNFPDYFSNTLVTARHVHIKFIIVLFIFSCCVQYNHVSSSELTIACWPSLYWPSVYSIIMYAVVTWRTISSLVCSSTIYPIVANDLSELIFIYNNISAYFNSLQFKISDIWRQ